MANSRVSVQAAAAWARSTANATQLTKKFDRARAEAALRALHVASGRGYPGAVFVDSAKELQEYARECGADGFNVLVRNRLMVLEGHLLRTCRPSDLRRFENETGSRVYWAVTGPVSGLADLSSLQFSTGQRMAPSLALYKFMWGRVAESDDWPSWAAKFLEALYAVAESCFAVYLGAESCAVLPPPLAVQLDGRGRLHSLDAAALVWPDERIYAVHGVAVPGLFVTERGKLSASTVLNEPNQERRAAYIELYGAERLLKSSKATLISTDDWGKLWRLDMGETNEPLVMVEVLNSTPEPDGSFRTYFLRVRPDCAPMGTQRRWPDPQQPTPLNAIASTFGMTGAEYAAGLLQET